MTPIAQLYTRISAGLESNFDWVLPLLARLIFAGVLLVYFWNAGVAKLGDGVAGLFKVTAGGFGQIFPKQAEAVLWDVTQMTLFQKAVVLAGTWAEFILPTLIVIGLLTRLAAVGMICFIVVQSLTDLYGHGGILHAETLGSFFDAVPDSAILDQRALWIFLMVTLMIKGAGVLSVDHIMRTQVFRNAELATT
ncbi:MAG: DoxX family membrane protein [Marinovum sp.]|nr:DoxX family membrane protein [Marinovum sp.]